MRRCDIHNQKCGAVLHTVAKGVRVVMHAFYVHLYTSSSRAIFSCLERWPMVEV